MLAVYKISMHLGYLGMGLLDLCLWVWETIRLSETIWFSKVAIPSYISSSNVERLQFSHSIAQNYYLVFFLIVVIYRSVCSVLFCFVSVWCSGLLLVLCSQIFPGDTQGMSNMVLAIELELAIFKARALTFVLSSHNLLFYYWTVWVLIYSRYSPLPNI